MEVAGRWGGLRRSHAMLAAVVMALVTFSACATSDSSDPSRGPANLPDHAFVRFLVGDEETFTVELTNADLVTAARELLAGRDVASIPDGRVVRDAPGPNAPWSWHLDPPTVSFSATTIEGCDGLPSEVEAGTVDGDHYCPSSASVVAVDAAP